MEGGRVKALYVLDPGPDGSIGDVSWIVAARRSGTLPLLVVQGVLMTELAAAADFVLPGAAYVEKDAIYTNDQGRVQAASRAIAPPGEAREDWQILVNLAGALGLTLPYTSSDDVRRALAAAMGATQAGGAYAQADRIAFARPVSARNWLQASNPSERWKWDFMFQDLPPVKGHNVQLEGIRRAAGHVHPADAGRQQQVIENVTLLAAFGAGLLSFISPCVLPLIPGYLSYISGLSLDEMRGTGAVAVATPAVRNRVLLSSLAFILGFSLVFVALGASASAIGQFLMSRLTILGRIAGAIIILFGLHTMGLLRIDWLYQEKRVQTTRRPAGFIGAMLVGIAFAFGWTPCIGPILAGILAIAAAQNTIGQGVKLLAGLLARAGDPVLCGRAGHQSLLLGVRAHPQALPLHRAGLGRAARDHRHPDLHEPLHRSSRARFSRTCRSINTLLTPSIPIGNFVVIQVTRT